MPVAIGTELREGDRLLIAEGSTAVVSFGEGCQMTLGAGAALAIGKGNPCQGSKLERIDLSGRMGNQTDGWDASLSEPEEDYWTEIGWILGGTGLAAGVIIAASQAGGNNDTIVVKRQIKPASP